MCFSVKFTVAFVECSSGYFGHIVASITIHTLSCAKRQEGGGEDRETEVCLLKKKAKENFALKVMEKTLRSSAVQLTHLL